MTETLCTCAKRPKHKCCEENEHGSGKMCLRELEVEAIFLDNSNINTIKDLATGEIWYRQFVEDQEYLGHEFEKILLDNLSDLYLE